MAPLKEVDTSSPPPAATTGSDISSPGSDRIDTRSERSNDPPVDRVGLLQGAENLPPGADTSQGYVPEVNIVNGKDSTGDPALAEATANKALGLIDKQADVYYKRTDKQYDRTPGHHENTADGSSYDMDRFGRLSTFHTGKTTDYPDGITYSNMKYDRRGELLSYQNTAGHTFTRLTQADREGFSTWTCHDKHGRPATYAGSDSHVWRGNISITPDEGFHSHVASGKNSGAVYSRSADGTFTQSTAIRENGEFVGIDSLVRMPDGSEVTAKSMFNNGKLDHDKNLSIASADGKTKSELKAPENQKPVAVAETQETAKSPQTDATVKIPEPAKTQEVAKAPDKPAMTSAEAAKAADTAIKAMDSIPALIDRVGAVFDKAEILNGATITSRSDGRHNLKLSLQRGMTLPSTKENMGPTRIAPEVNLTIGQNQNRRNNARNMGENDTLSVDINSGVRSTAYGPLGGGHPAWATGIHIGRERDGDPYMRTEGSGQGPLGRVRSRSEKQSGADLANSGPLGQAISENPQILDSIQTGLDAFKNSGITGFDMKKNDRQMNFSLAMRSETDIPINQTIGAPGAGISVESLHLNKTLGGSVIRTDDSVTVQFDESRQDSPFLRVNAAGSDLQLKPTKMTIKDAQGSPEIALSVKNPFNESEIMDFGLKKTGDGKYDLSYDGKTEKSIPINQEIQYGIAKLNVDSVKIAPNAKMTVERDANGQPAISNIEGLTINNKLASFGKEVNMALSPRKITFENKDGVQMVNPSNLNAEPMVFSIPASQIIGDKPSALAKPKSP
ncbi:MAG: hypothetical protein K2W82_07910 [Candidatus Obscuribacterales bacterium]|nr:hypothetical protein [Candidatus Obscuribacterales bacterium]